jgi:hypothetical protein
LNLFIELFSTASSNGVGDYHDDKSEDDEPYDGEDASDGSRVGEEPILFIFS